MVKGERILRCDFPLSCLTMLDTFRVMRDNDLLAVVKRRVKTTDSTHGYGRYPNLIRDYPIMRPDQVWCTNITYIHLQ